MLHSGTVAWPPERYWTRRDVSRLLAKPRQALTADGGACFNGGCHDDEWVQWEGTLAIFSCCAKAHYSANGAIKNRNHMPHLSMAIQAP